MFSGCACFRRVNVMKLPVLSRHSSIWAIVIWLFFSFAVRAEDIRVPVDANDKQQLPTILLQTALERGGKYNMVFPYRDIDSLPLSTRINGVANGEFDLFVALTTPEYERDFLPIYIPVYRGMMGMRLAVIKASNKHMFKDVRTISDLRKFTAGQGKFWADSKILEENRIPLVKELKYPNLFRMLEADRFDYFPRGIQEPWSELNNWQSLDLTVDEHIMLWYKVPFYYFVSRAKPALALHIQEQLEAMVADGSYLKLFWENPRIQQAVNNAKLNERTVIRLDNPFLTAKTPINRKELWFDPAELQQRTANRL